MIVRFRHNGLQLLYEKGDRRRVSPAYVAKIERILAASTRQRGLRTWIYRGFGYIHEGQPCWLLVGQRVRNWRIVFCFEGVHASDVDLID